MICSLFEQGTDVKSNITREICSIAFSRIIACMARRSKQKKKGKMRPAKKKKKKKKKRATEDFSHSSILYTNPAVGTILSNLAVDEK